MDIKKLKEYLDKLAQKLDEKDKNLLNDNLKNLVAVFPFNEYEYTIMLLHSRKLLDFEEYEKLRRKYVSYNKYLHLYELAPRIFGEIWGQDHIRGLDNRFQKPTKELDPEFNGEYDLWIEGIKVEVKAARAIKTKVRGGLVSKAMSYGALDAFWMNFQQLKPDSCDIFVFVGVWIGQIEYWILSRKEIKKNKYISHQHRGGIEYQIGITDKNIKEFDIYKVGPFEIGDIVIRKGN